MTYDTLIVNGTVVIPEQGAVRADVAVRNGRIAALGDGFDSSTAAEVIDAEGLLVLPGAVDAHYHLGIYRSIAEDASSETESSLVGGATSVISYFRTGHHYLNRTGPYREILPEVIAATAGQSHTDFGYHLAPMDEGHVQEIDWLVSEAGVSSFKYFFFYRGLNLAADSADAQAYTMTDDYGFGHLYSIMEAVARADESHGRHGRVSLSLHCEDPELIKLFIKRVQEQSLPPLEAYSKARPPLGERLTIHEAGVLADANRVRLNLLHLSSAEALRGLREIRSLYPGLDIRAETTLHHLCLTYSMLEGKGLGGKVNPPIREQSDVESLWAAIETGELQWVASDHACCLEELKGDDLWPALPGFGGTALLYPVMLSEGHLKRGLSLERIAELVSTSPARAYGLYPRKGTIAVGADADLALVDLDLEQVVTPSLLHSAQDHTPFEGISVRGWPRRTLLRGRTVFQEGEVVSPPTGEFLLRGGAARREDVRSLA